MLRIFCHNKIVVNYLFLICLFPFNAIASQRLTNLDSGVTLYSEYYPNLTTKFKGTIIFINGSGADISEWTGNKKFFKCVKKMGALFFYNRSGLGKSPPNLQLSSSNPITAKLISNQLSVLIKKLNIKPPYVIVAHSFGALYAGYFTLKNPNFVKALLLIDPAPRDFKFSTKAMKKNIRGIEEAKIKPASYIYKKYKGPNVEILYQLLGLNESKQSIKALGSINDDIPVVIISSSEMEKNNPLEQDWFTSQKQWLNQNVMSKIIQVPSDHFIQLTNPQPVCNELKQILLAVRASRISLSSS